MEPHLHTTFMELPAPDYYCMI